MGNVRWPLIIRMLAGVYLIYLGISMIGEIQKGAVTGGMLILGVVAIAAFFVFAVWAFVSSIRTIIADQKKSEDVDEEEEQRKAEEEEKERLRALAAQNSGNSLFARMNRFSGETEEASEEETEAADEPEETAGEEETEE